MAEFRKALKDPGNGFRRAGILGYIGSVNSDQKLEAEAVS